MPERPTTSGDAPVSTQFPSATANMPDRDFRGHPGREPGERLADRLARQGFHFDSPERQAWRERFGKRFADTGVLARNLLDFKNVLERHSVPYFLAQGTLLAAIREGSFFAHSRDCDLYTFWDDRYRLLDAVPDLAREGFAILKLLETRTIRKITFARDAEHIDINFLVRDRIGPIRLARTNDGRYPANWFSGHDEVAFLGTIFPAPRNSTRYLERRYGSAWRTTVHKMPEMSSFRHTFETVGESCLWLSVPTPLYPFRALESAPILASRPDSRIDRGRIVLFASGTRACLRCIRDSRADGSVRVYGGSKLAHERWWPRDSVLAVAHAIRVGRAVLSLHSGPVPIAFRQLCSALAKTKAIVRKLPGKP